MPSYTDINAQTWDRWAADGCEWSVPISHEEYLAADESNFRVFLTPCVPVPHSWFGSLKGARLLGLASGGGQQMPVFAKLGAECTVFDYSLRQLEAERMVAAREGYDIRIVRGDMTRRLPFDDACFDLIFIRYPIAMWRMWDTSGGSASACCGRAAGCWPALTTASTSCARKTPL